MGTLRLTGGTLRSRRVAAPSGRAVRPTPARVKEALFSIVAERMPDAVVLDLFAGTGALGFEALSRGAARVTFVEAHRATAAALRATGASLGVAASMRVLALSAERAAETVDGSYDLVFADPPYAMPFPARVFARLAARGALTPASLVVYEHSAAAAPPSDDATLALARTARYGAVALAFMTLRAAPEAA